MVLLNVQKNVLCTKTLQYAVPPSFHCVTRARGARQLGAPRGGHGRQVEHVCAELALELLRLRRQHSGQHLAPLRGSVEASRWNTASTCAHHCSDGKMYEAIVELLRISQNV